MAAKILMTLIAKTVTDSRRMDEREPKLGCLRSVPTGLAVVDDPNAEPWGFQRPCWAGPSSVVS